jgi:hypothetical protein
LTDTELRARARAYFEAFAPPHGTLASLVSVITSMGWDVVTIGEYPDYRVCFVVRDRWGAFSLSEVRDEVETWRVMGTRVTVDA